MQEMTTTMTTEEPEYPTKSMKRLLSDFERCNDAFSDAKRMATRLQVRISCEFFAAYNACLEAHEQDRKELEDFVERLKAICPVMQDFEAKLTEILKEMEKCKK